MRIVDETERVFQLVVEERGYSVSEVSSLVEFRYVFDGHEVSGDAHEVSLIVSKGGGRPVPVGGVILGEVEQVAYRVPSKRGWVVC